MFPLILAMFDSMVQKLRKTCLRLPLTQRSLFLDENLRLCAKNEAPKEEAVCATLFRETAHLPHPCNPFFYSLL